MICRASSDLKEKFFKKTKIFEKEIVKDDNTSEFALNKKTNNKKKKNQPSTQVEVVKATELDKIYIVGLP